ncbi:MAG: hypothetical protein HY706_01745 [Candidatus Hydrogenedentes bacterium]|nr:hypothetical protein [Candidatus Hydrogenedentota bacterium]
MGISDVQVQDFGGVDEMPARMGAFSQSANFGSVECLGVIRDAENNPSAAFHSISNALRKSNLDDPGRPGTITRGKPRIGIFILPEANSVGAIEDLCLMSIEGEPVMDCINSFVECVHGMGVKIRKSSKAKVAAFLSTRDEPGLLIGQAAARKYWPWGHTAFDSIKQFLLELFDSRKERHIESSPEQA